MEKARCLSLPIHVAITKISQSGLITKHLLLTVLEAGKSKINTLANAVAGKDQLSWFLGGCFLPVSFYGREGEIYYNMQFNDLVNIDISSIHNVK